MVKRGERVHKIILWGRHCRGHKKNLWLNTMSILRKGDIYNGI